VLVVASPAAAPATTAAHTSATAEIAVLDMGGRLISYGG
jgi:hypothetical protein